MKLFLIFILSLGLCQRLYGAEYKLVWSPEADKDGLKAFEGVEDERGHVHKVTHIKVEDNNYRFDIHTQDRDAATGSDRQRQEVKGMVQNGKQLRMMKGETWKFTYSMYIPSTLHATTSFTHIAQMKVPNADGDNGDLAPIYVMSLRRKGEEETIEAQVTTGAHILGSANLMPLKNKWIDVELEYHVDDVKGSANWTIISDSKAVVHGTKDNVKTFFTDAVRPKWGIYRSLKDTKEIIDAHLLLTKMRAYKME